MPNKSGRQYVENEFRRSLQMIAMPPKARAAYFPKGANIPSEVVLDFIGYSEGYIDLNRSAISPEFHQNYNLLRDTLMTIYDSNYADSIANSANWEIAGDYARTLLDALSWPRTLTE